MHLKLSGEKAWWMVRSKEAQERMTCQRGLHAFPGNRAPREKGAPGLEEPLSYSEQEGTTSEATDES